MEESVNSLIGLVCTEYNVDKDALLGDRRYQPIAEARQMAMWLLRRRALLNVCEIGQIFSRKHPTVCYNISQIHAQLKFDKRLKKHYENIRQQLND